MMIESLCDNDLYKFTMMQFVFHQHPEAIVEYQLFYRKQNIKINKYNIDILKKEINSITLLRFKEEEIQYLQGLNFFSADFLIFLKSFSLKRDSIILEEEGGLSLKIRGRWVDVILWEVILLALINEIHFKENALHERYMQIARVNLKNKINFLKKIPQKIQFIEFGTRRRFSRNWQDELNRTLKDNCSDHFLGTSNIKFAMDLNIKCYGTIGHELLQASQRISPSLETFQTQILNSWHTEYKGKLGIALSDVLSTQAFLYDFQGDLARKYTGIRIDSGDPFQIGDEVVNFYLDQGIDPLSKVLIFSDSISFEKASNLAKHFERRIQIVFGIGTYLTNDHGVEPLKFVIKMTSFNERAVGKLTDSPDKTFCLDSDFLEKLHLINAKKSSAYIKQRRAPVESVQ